MPELKRKPPDRFSGKPANRVRPEYILRLFVSGILDNSVRAVRNISRICEDHLKDNYELEIIDIYQRPDLATSEQIIVVPVMIIKAHYRKEDNRRSVKCKNSLGGTQLLINSW